MNRADLEVGMRVHHRGGIYSADWTSRPLQGGPYWGTVLEIHPQYDGTAECLIQADAHHLPEYPNEPRWWASYHIDRIGDH